MFYFRGSLRTEARLIETIEDTYESLFKAFEKRFVNKQAVIDIHSLTILITEDCISKYLKISHMLHTF